MNKLALKVAHNQPKSLFSVLPTSPKPAKISIFFHKNGSLHDFYVMTLVMSGSKLVSFLRIKMLLPATTATISPLIYNECLSLRNTIISKVREYVLWFSLFIHI